MKLKSLQKRYAEVWQENETSIVIKMLTQSMKDQDHSRTLELQRSLLELERKSDVLSDEESPIDFKNLPEPLRHQPKSKSVTVSPTFGPSPSPSCFSDDQFSPKELEYLKKAVQQNTKQYDLQINITLVGNSGCGKTSLMNAWLGSPSPMKTKPTTGLDSKTLVKGSLGKMIRYKFIDCDGDKGKEFIRKGNFFRGEHKKFITCHNSVL